MNSSHNKHKYPKTVDVAIIGGGIIGLLSAFFLAQRGCSVAVFDKGQLCHEQSSRNWGWCRSFGRDLREVKLANRAMKLWPELTCMLGVSINFHQCGINYLAGDEAQALSYENYCQHFKGPPSCFQLISKEKLSGHLPGIKGDCKLAIHVPGDGLVDPVSVCRSLISALKQMNVRLFPNSEVTGIERQTGRTSAIRIGNCEVGCKNILVAAGAWSSRFLRSLGIQFPQAVVISSVQSTSPLEGAPKTCVFGDGFAFGPDGNGGYRVGHGAKSVLPITPENLRALPYFSSGLKKEWKFLRGYLSPRLDKTARSEWLNLISGYLSGVSAKKPHVFAPEPDAVITKDAMNNLISCFPVFRNAQITKRWAGVIEASPDGVPVISSVKNIPGLFISTGFSGHGFGLAPAACEMVANLITGEEITVNKKSFSIDRFDGSLPVTTGVRI